MPDASLVCVGPTGIGFFLVVEQLPARDTGVYASHGSTMLICDAAIVASELASYGEVALITNNLGPQSESSSLRQHLRSRRLHIYEDSQQQSILPFDVIMLERSTASRTFVTTGFCPKKAHISRVLAGLFAPDAGAQQNQYLYLDAEINSPPANEVMQALTAVAAEPVLALVNLGDVADLTAVLPIIQGSIWPTSTAFQVSFKNGNINEIERFAAHKPCRPVIATMGAQGAHMIVDGSCLHSISEPVHTGLTVGAGAIFSAGLLIAAIQGGRSMIDQSCLTAAAGRASQFVMDFSDQRYRESIFIQ